MAKPTSSSGFPRDTPEPVLQEYRDQNMLVSHPYMTQHTYPHHPLPLTDYNGKQPGHYHPPTWQNSSSPSPNHPQPAVHIQPNSANTARIPAFSERANHQSHLTPHPMTVPPTRSHPTTHWDQKNPSNPKDTNYISQRYLSESDRISALQFQASQETLKPPAEITTQQTSFQYGVDKIAELVAEEMVNMRTYFEGLVMDMKNQLSREQAEKELLRKRVHELERELQKARDDNHCSQMTNDQVFYK